MLKTYPNKIHPKLHARGRAGIPNSLRGFAWCLLTNANTGGHTITGRSASIVGSALNSNLKGETDKLMSNIME